MNNICLFPQRYTKIKFLTVYSRLGINSHWSSDRPGKKLYWPVFLKRGVGKL